MPALAGSLVQGYPLHHTELYIWVQAEEQVGRIRDLGVSGWWYLLVMLVGMSPEVGVVFLATYQGIGIASS